MAESEVAVQQLDRGMRDGEATKRGSTKDAVLNERIDSVVYVGKRSTELPRELVLPSRSVSVYSYTTVCSTLSTHTSFEHLS